MEINDKTKEQLIKESGELRQKIIELEKEKTEYKKAEEELKKFKFISDKSNDAHFLLGRDAKFIYVNETACKMLGYSKNELLNLGVSDVDIVYDSSKYHDLFGSVQKGVIPPIETINKRKDGTTFPSEITVTGYHIEGQPYMFAALRDITERKQVEEKLRTNEAFIKLVLDNVPIGIAVNSVDPTVTFNYMNDNFPKYYRTTKDKLADPDAFWDSVYEEPEFREEIKKRVLDDCSSGNPERMYWVDVPITRKGDETTFITAKNIPIPDKQLMISTVWDVTDFKKAEQALRNSEETLNLAHEVANIGSWVWDINTNKLVWSQKVYEMFGFDPAQSPPVYQDFINCLHPDDLELVKRSIEDAVKQQKLFDIEYRIIRPSDREEKVIHAKGKVFYDDKGKAVRLLGMVFDITKYKKLEEELQKIHKLESIGILAGGIAHDFNNLLAAIRNNIYLSMMHVDRENIAYGNLELTENIIHRATNLTQQLLTFSKGGAPVKKTASIVELIRESAEFVLRGSNVKCEYSITDNTWPVDMDEGQMNQVIHNLILNAVQSMPKGGAIRISTENSNLGSDAGLPLQEGKYVKIIIQDQGIGIADEHLKNIFDPYYTTKKTGRGLGLSITYSIINQHDGLLTVESERGTGTIFTIYLPASEKEIAEKEIAEDTFAVGEGKVLIMDDEEIIRDSVGQLLTHMGYEVECVKNGEESIELYKKAIEASQPFDVLILDLTIRGGMGGKEAVKKLLEIDPDVKAIVASGYSNDPVLANFREYGFCGVFAKHDKTEELGKTLHKVING